MSLNLSTDTLSCPNCGGYEFTEEKIVMLGPDDYTLSKMSDYEASKSPASIKSFRHRYKCITCGEYLKRGGW